MAEVGAMNIVTEDELRALLDKESVPSVSFYMPTKRVAVEPEENSLHLKNLLGTARGLLEERGLRRPERDDLLAPVEALLDRDDFWLHCLEGLALFRSADAFEHFDLHFPVAEEVRVGSSFFIKPLMAALYPPAHFYVLALSQNTVRLLRCDRYRVDQVDLEPFGVPSSLEQALQYDDLQKPELQHHPTTGPGREHEGRAPVPDRAGPRQHAFHGHGESGEGAKTQLRRYFQLIDTGLAKALANESAPVILASVDYLQPLFREATSYRHILQDSIDGSPDRIRDESLHQKALAIIRRRMDADLGRAREKYENLNARGLASCDLGTVVDAADAGRIDTLFVTKEAEPVWGTFDRMDRKAERHEQRGSEDVDLVELAIRATFSTSGIVFLVEPDDMPREEHMAAILRY